MCHDHIDGIVSLEGDSSRDHLIHAYAKGIKVGALIGLSVLGLLRRYVMHRAHHRRVRRILRHRPGYAEISHLHLSILGNDQILGLYVPVDYALLVGSGYAFCSLETDAYGLLIGQPPLSGYIVFKGDALNKLHDYVMELSLIHRIISRHNVGMGKVCGGSCLIAEFFQEFLVPGTLLLEHLYGNDTVKLRILCPVYIGHAALTDL